MVDPEGTWIWRSGYGGGVPGCFVVGIIDVAQVEYAVLSEGADGARIGYDGQLFEVELYVHGWVPVLL